MQLSIFPILLLWKEQGDPGPSMIQSEILSAQVTHLLPATSNLDDYILLHPDAAKYIWFPDIYIGKGGVSRI